MEEINTGSPETGTSPSEFDVDSYMAQAEGGSQPPAEQAPAVQEYEFKANGRSIKAPIDKILQYAAQGHGAPTRIGELNKQIQDFQTRQKTYDEKYGAIDEYVRQNPQFWDHVTSTWQARAQQAAPTTSANDPQYQLEQRLSHAEKFIQTAEQREQTQRIEQEDKALDQKIQSVRETYKDLDWNTLDENGHNLELQTIAYASKNGIKDFESAFKASQYDNMIKRAEERGKEQIAKTRVQNNKLGLLGKTTQAPKQEGISRLENAHSKSDRDVLNEALREAGIL